MMAKADDPLSSVSLKNNRRTSDSKRNANLERAIFGFLLFVAVIVIGALVYLYIRESKKSPSEPTPVIPTEKPTTSKPVGWENEEQKAAFQAAAAFLETYMNTSVKPCENFFNFSCGNAPANTSFYQVMREKIFNETMDLLTEKNQREVPPVFEALQEIFRLCYERSTGQQEPDWKLIDRIVDENVPGSYFSHGTNENVFSRNFYWNYLKLIGGIGFRLLGFYLDADKIDSEVPAFYVYFNFHRLKKELVMRKFSYVLQEYWKAHSSHKLPSNIDVEGDIEKVLDQLIKIQEKADDAAFEWSPAVLTELKPEREFREGAYRPFRRFLQEHLQIAWRDSNRNSRATRIYWSAIKVETFKEFLKVIMDRNNQIAIKNILASEVIAQFLAGNNQSEAVNNQSIPFHDTDTIFPMASLLDPKGMKCAADANYFFKLPMLNLFAEKEGFTVEHLVEYRRIGEDVRNQFEQLLLDADWLDSDRKLHALDKLNSIGAHLGFPREIFNSSWIQQFYKDLDYGGLELKHQPYEQWVVERNKFTFNRNTNPAVWKSMASLSKYKTLMNARYGRLLNAYWIELGNFRKPSFDLAYPLEVQYAGLARVIGHEIGHAFDPACMKGGLNLKQEIYEKDMQCFIKQYSQFCEKGKCVHGKRTLSENIADYFGLKTAYMALQARKDQERKVYPQVPGFEHLSSDQLFFFAYSKRMCQNSTSMEHSVHSPPRYRLIGTLQNSVEFAEAFKCPSGTLMNADNKCKL